ncbi:imidazolonepropionase [Rhizobium sp. SSA_523]|uniref:imidazolonepropionase n=1 Tax=Rhizobium sp. SSA_523 TaxID=2952477 RepID=UPI002091DC64|nr:imidazolonepropionase [Rhizobium sp. SSA_523]MCO5731238.1 imidazolonepropionase [Rhizobium sp. SSA_523]WKC22224.1 imidazolonepropionase [Rhizobium sp. SSA_523]
MRTSPPQQTLYRNARLVTLAPDLSGQGSSGEGLSGLGVIADGVIAVAGAELTFVGRRTDLPRDLQGAETIDLEGRLVTPALIDCHTHLVFGGNRAKEFEMRLNGATYEDISRAGGGIVSSVTATRAQDVEALAQGALARLDHLLAEGVSTVEIKSGYGLDIPTELNMLRAARRLAALREVRIKTSYLAAHATPAEYKGRKEAYLAEVVLPGLELAHSEGLVDAVDGFCEGIAFSPDEMARVFQLARSLGLPVKLHAEQLSNLGGAKLAASFGALSADHLEYLDQDGVLSMAQAGTVAVLLPGAFYTLNETRKPPVALLRQAGVPLAIATDCNPGTSPLTSLLLAMNMAATLFGLTIEECIAGTTREAARALGLHRQTGTLEPGKSADLAVWDVESPAELVYRIGYNPLHARIFQGQRIER